jgi:hypothetical protein
MRTLRIAIAITALAITALGADNTLGTWKINPAKSKVPAGNSPITDLTITREAAGNGVKVTGKGKRQDGSTIDITYTATYDGKPTTVSGSGLPYDTVAVTQVNASTTKDVRSKNGGKYQGTGEFKVSKDGKTATLTSKGTNAEGKPFSGMSVYDKM